MKYRIFILIFFLISCEKNYSNSPNKPFTSKGFAYIYNETDFKDGLIKKKLDTNSLEIAHSKLRPGSLIKITNLKTNDAIILKNKKRFEFPDFYKIMITKLVAEKINLDEKLPLVEIIELKKNKSFVAKKTKIFKEEEKIHSNAPITSVKIDNISKNIGKKKNFSKQNFFIIIGEFYSKESALFLKKRIEKELYNFKNNKLFINSKKTNKITLLSGPYNSINLMKNDYILLKRFGFEELDITTNE